MINLDVESSKDEVQQWVESQTWYQRIRLSNGIETPGKIDSKQRTVFFEDENFANKTVIDIGCNSGYYCLWAKRMGARRVVGVDLDQMRLEQAKTIACVEGIEIEYYRKSLEEATTLGGFDYVFCFAVITEIRDLLGSLVAVSELAGKRAYVELAIAKPVLYISRSSFWLKALFKRKYSTSVVEMKRSKNYWTLAPSLRAVETIVGCEFKVSYIGEGLRYDMVVIERK